MPFAKVLDTGRGNDLIRGERELGVVLVMNLSLCASPGSSGELAGWDLEPLPESWVML